MFDAKTLPTYIPLIDNQGELVVETVLRHLPGKRFVVKGVWQDQTVIGKLFYVKPQYKKYIAAEKKGYEILQKSHLATPKWLNQTITQPLGKNNIRFGLIIFEYLAPDKENIPDTCIIEMVAKQHQHGIMQTDCHKNNYLLHLGLLYCLDLSSIIQVENTGKPLSQQKCLQNVAAYLAQLSRIFDETCQDWLTRYSHIRGWSKNLEITKTVRQFFILENKKLYQERLAKVIRNSTEFYVKNNHSFSVIVRRQHFSKSLEAFFNDPETFIESGNVIKAGNTCTVVKVLLADKAFLIKRYNIKSGMHALKRIVQRGRGWWSWINGYRLMHCNIDTPRPIALLQYKKYGLKRETYLVSEYIEGQTLAQYLSGRDWTVQKLAVLADTLPYFFKILEAYKLCHGDLKATNWLVSQNKLFIADLDSMRVTTGDSKKDKARFLKNWQADLPLQRYLAMLIS